jgi:hypothetical protein
MRRAKASDGTLSYFLSTQHCARVLDSVPMSSAPAAVVDVLNSLLESQQNSIVRFMGVGSPYIANAPPEVRTDLKGMLAQNLRRCDELFRTIEQLGGSVPPRRPRPEEQYLSYLSLKFLLPKLVDAKRLVIQRYENAQKAVGREPSAAVVVELLDRHLADHRAELATLESDAARVAADG